MTVPAPAPLWPPPCPECGGDGTVDVACGYCAGRSPQFHCRRCSDTGLVAGTCGECGGDGKAGTYTCDVCCESVDCAEPPSRRYERAGKERFVCGDCDAQEPLWEGA